MKFDIKLLTVLILLIIINSQMQRYTSEKMTNEPLEPQIDTNFNKQYDDNLKNVKSQGWWQDVIECSNNSNYNLYCKPKNEWIWPY